MTGMLCRSKVYFWGRSGKAEGEWGEGVVINHEKEAGSPKRRPGRLNFV